MEMNKEIITPDLQVNQTQSNRITKNSKKVAAYDKNNNFIKEFESIALAAKYCEGDASIISAVCKGKRKTHKDYIWRYIDID